MEFLGLNTAHMPSLVNHNANTAMRSKALARVIQDPNHPVTSIAKKLLPKTIWKQGKILLKKINTDHSPRPPLSAELKMELRREARTHVEELQSYLHKTGLNPVDLMMLWDYPVDN